MKDVKKIKERTQGVHFMESNQKYIVYMPKLIDIKHKRYRVSPVAQFINKIDADNKYKELNEK